MKVKVVKGYDLTDVDDGAFLPKEDLPEITVRYQCGECDEIYEDRDEAKECCREECRRIMSGG